MKLCLDCQPAVAQRAGIGRYTRELARHIARLCGTGDELRLCYMDFRRRGESPLSSITGDAGHTTSSQIVERPFRILPGAIIQQCWKRFGFPDYSLLAGRADLYHFTNFTIPPLKRGLAVTTVFDLSYEHFPQFAEEKNLRYLRARMPGTIDRADRIITISEFSAREIEEFYPAARGKTRAIPLGIDPFWRKSDDAEIDAARKIAGVPSRPFILSVGTIEPRKNYPFLADLFDALPDDDLDLVIAGRAGWRCEPIFDHIKAARRFSRIHIVQGADDTVLRGLYSSASAFVLPSFYEGFGFPPLEAMACGAPVLSAATGSLPEVLGDAASLVEGFDIDKWHSALLALLGEDSAARATRMKQGIARAASFTWSRTCEETWGVYRELCPN